MSQQAEIIHFTLEDIESRRFFRALKAENSKRDAPIGKNPFSKILVNEALKRRGF